MPHGTSWPWPKGRVSLTQLPVAPRSQSGENEVLNDTGQGCPFPQVKKTKQNQQTEIETTNCSCFRFFFKNATLKQRKRMFMVEIWNFEERHFQTLRSCFFVLQDLVLMKVHLQDSWTALWVIFQKKLREPFFFKKPSSSLMCLWVVFFRCRIWCAASLYHGGFRPILWGAELRETPASKLIGCEFSVFFFQVAFKSSHIE